MLPFCYFLFAFFQAVFAARLWGHREVFFVVCMTLIAPIVTAALLVQGFIVLTDWLLNVGFGSRTAK